MKKLCGLLQKINGWIGVGVFTLLAVFALGMATPTAPLSQYDGLNDFYDAFQPYNDIILYFAIAGIVVSLFYSLLRNNIRKVFYVSNFIWSGLYLLLAVIAPVYAFQIIALYQSKYLSLDFATINAYFAEKGNVYLDPNTSVFLLGYLVCGCVLLSVVPVGFVAVMKGREKWRLRKAKGQSLPKEEIK